MGTATQQGGNAQQKASFEKIGEKKESVVYAEDREIMSEEGESGVREV